MDAEVTVFTSMTGSKEKKITSEALMDADTVAMDTEVSETRETVLEPKLFTTISVLFGNPPSWAERSPNFNAHGVGIGIGYGYGYGDAYGITCCSGSGAGAIFNDCEGDGTGAVFGVSALDGSGIS